LLNVISLQGVEEKVMAGKTAVQDHNNRSTKSKKSATVTVIEHVLNRLWDIGIKDVFAVAGDYAF